MIYLYVKTHNKTGLKYLGQTKSKDPHKYKGSGKRWKNHIRKHGYDVSTEILLACESKQDIIEKGLYYSNLWNVVESNEWANLKEESGDGGFEHYSWKGRKRSMETRLRLSELKKGKYLGQNNPNYGNKWSEEKKEALSNLRKTNGKSAGENNPMYGKKRTDLSERNKAGRGKHWYTDGIISKQYFPHEVPTGWQRGRVTCSR